MDEIKFGMKEGDLVDMFYWGSIPDSNYIHALETARDKLYELRRFRIKEWQKNRRVLADVNYIIRQHKEEEYQRECNKAEASGYRIEDGLDYADYDESDYPENC